MTRDLLEIEVSPLEGQALAPHLGRALVDALRRIGIRSKDQLDAEGRLLLRLLNVDDDEARFAIGLVRNAGYRIGITVTSPLPSSRRTAANPTAR